MIQDDKASVNSMRTMAITRCGAAANGGNPVLSDTLRDAVKFIGGTLLNKGLVHNYHKLKWTPSGDDLKKFIYTLFNREFLCQLSTTREAFLMVLFVNLQIDCGSRSGELLMSSEVKSIRSEVKTMTPEKVYCWRSVELFVFRHEGRENSLAARVTFYYTKGAIGR